jgi:peptide/nickel transport system permease protein
MAEYQDSVGVVLKKKKRLISPSTAENWRIYRYKFTRNKLSVAGLIIVCLSIFFAVFAPVIMPYPKEIGPFVDFANAHQPPSSVHWFGTDNIGRDVFSRVIYSFRGAMIMSIVVLAISVPIGTILGLIAGYYHGTIVDTIIMRFTDVFLSIPALILALAIASILKPNMINSMIAVTVMWWPWYTRLVYGQASSISREYFVRNAELIGASKAHILLREILPNCLSPITTKMALDVAWVILMGAALSFVGLGEQPPTPAFGQMISDGSKFMPDLWWMTIFPALGVVFMILGFNFFGDGIRDMFDKGAH